MPSIKSNIVWILLYICLSQHLFAQLSNEKPLVPNKIQCKDIAFNASVLFKKYYQANKLDSARQILNFWEEKCGNKETVRRASIILALKSYSYHDSLVNYDHISNIYDYLVRIAAQKSNKSSHFNYFESYIENTQDEFYYIKPGQEFDLFTRKEATKLIQKYNKGTIEYLLSKFYAGLNDSIFTKIQGNEYSSTDFHHSYFHEINKYKKVHELHTAIVSGLWIPNGPIRKLGVHPEIGFLFGGRINDFTYDFSFNFRFIYTPEFYEARRKDGTIELTKKFLGGYVGLGLGWTLLKPQENHEIRLLFGGGYDGFDALPENSENNLESVSVNAFNFNLGLAYRYYMRGTHYIEMAFKHNLVDYTSNNVIDLKGNAISAQVILGWLEHKKRDKVYNKMRYKKWWNNKKRKPSFP